MSWLVFSHERTQKKHKRFFIELILSCRVRRPANRVCLETAILVSFAVCGLVVQDFTRAERRGEIRWVGWRRVFHKV
jgi:hypothetical protein